MRWLLGLRRLGLGGWLPPGLLELRCRQEALPAAAAVAAALPPLLAACCCCCCCCDRLRAAASDAMSSAAPLPKAVIDDLNGEPCGGVRDACWLVGGDDDDHDVVGHGAGRGVQDERVHACQEGHRTLGALAQPRGQCMPGGAVA